MLLKCQETLLHLATGFFVWRKGSKRIKKMNSENDDVGIQTVQEIYNSLQVDEEWSIREERGFTWWANQGKLRDVYVFMRCQS
jgi:hypothetical protein